ncbi:MAG: hypothetical protein KC944_25530, partial [Candidatus Omnitrophica bacterium]|nr:hypothetical protein [Candidatus Omnitrophota bacterium]
DGVEVVGWQLRPGASPYPRHSGRRAAVSRNPSGIVRSRMDSRLRGNDGDGTLVQAIEYLPHPTFTVMFPRIFTLRHSGRRAAVSRNPWASFEAVWIPAFAGMTDGEMCEDSGKDPDL